MRVALRDATSSIGDTPRPLRHHFGPSVKHALLCKFGAETLDVTRRDANCDLRNELRCMCMCVCVCVCVREEVVCARVTDVRSARLTCARSQSVDDAHATRHHARRRADRAVCAGDVSACARMCVAGVRAWTRCDRSRVSGALRPTQLAATRGRRSRRHGRAREAHGHRQSRRRARTAG
jgi:hypothetical protein